MSNESLVEQFQKEFRESVNKKLDYLTDKIDKMPMLFANQAEFNLLKEKVDALNGIKNKAVGIVITVQAVLAVIGYLLVHFK